MIRTNETALICDLAETYGVLDWRALPLRTSAALATGLRDNSRIKMDLSGIRGDVDTLLLASAVDRLSLLVWSKTKDAEKGINKPESIFQKLTGEEETPETEAFDSAEDFQTAWSMAIKKEG